MEDYRQINGEQQNKKKERKKNRNNERFVSKLKKKVNQASTWNTRFLTCMRTHTHTHKKQQQKDVYIHEHTHIIISPLDSEMKSESVSC